MYGASVFETSNNPINFKFDAIGKNSESITLGDPLSISGAASACTIGVVAAATSRVVGVAVKTATMSATNQTVAKVAPGYVPAYTDTLFLMGSNADFTSTLVDAGTYYKLYVTDGTGKIQVDRKSSAQTGTSRVVEIVQVDPYGIGSTGSGSGLRQVVVRFVKTPWVGVPTSS